MPYVSDAQRKFFHTATAKKQGITPAMVSEYDNASKGMALPDHVVEKGLNSLKKKKKKKGFDAPAS